MHTKGCEKSTEDKLDFCVWAQRRNPSDTQSSRGTDCCVLNSHHVSRAFPWALLCSSSFPFTTSCSVIHHQRSRLCALPGNTITTERSCPGGLLPSCHIHCMTRVPLLLSQPFAPPSAVPYPSALPSLNLHYLGNIVALSGYGWPAARHCTGSGSSSSVLQSLPEAAVVPAQHQHPQCTAPSNLTRRFAHTCQMWQLLQGKP